MTYAVLPKRNSYSQLPIVDEWPIYSRHCLQHHCDLGPLSFISQYISVPLSPSLHTRLLFSTSANLFIVPGKLIIGRINAFFAPFPSSLHYFKHQKTEYKLLSITYSFFQLSVSLTWMIQKLLTFKHTLTLKNATSVQLFYRFIYAYMDINLTFFKSRRVEYSLLVSITVQTLFVVIYISPIQASNRSNLFIHVNG